MSNVTLTGPVAVVSELFGEVFLLVRENSFSGEKVPFPGVGFKGNRQQRHVGLLRGLVVFMPVATSAGCDHIFPAILSPSGRRLYVVSRQFRSRELTPAVQAAVIISSKQGFVGQGRAETVNDSPLDGDDGLNVDARLSAGESLEAS